MKRVLITGAAGFIGSNALKYFATNKEFPAIATVDVLTYASDIKRINEFVPEMVRNMDVTHDTVVNFAYDIASPQMAYIIKKTRPDVIINFAAESHVDNSMLDITAHEFVSSNYQGAINLVHAIRRHKKETGKDVFLLQVSTDEVLGDLPVFSQEEYKEDQVLNPNNLYAATKAAAEQVLHALHHTFHDFNYAIVRATNNYGPNQHFEKFIPTVIRSILKREKIPIYGKGENVREWLWTEDFVRGIELVIKKHFTTGSNGATFHFGSGVRKTNLEVVHTITSVMEQGEDLITFVQDRPGHDRKYALNCDRAKKELGWKTQMDFMTGIKLVVNDIRRRTEND